MWMNEYDIEDALNRTPEGTNLERGAQILYRLKNWTNENSDGWPYWQKPSKAAKKLMELLYWADRSARYSEDCTEADLKSALVPIKSFLTRHGVEHSKVLL
jgi:hypothetical protein